MSPSDPTASPPRRGRRTLRLLGETLTTATTQPVMTALVAVVAAAVTATVLATTGQTAAAEASVLSRLDERGARTIRIVDPDGTAGVSADAVARIADAAGVAWVVGLGPVSVGRNAQLPARPVTARVVVVPDTPPADLGLPPQTRPGDTVAGTAALPLLGMRAAAGGIALEDGSNLALRGVASATGALTDLNDDVLTLAAPTAAVALRALVIEAIDVADVQRATRAALALAGAAAPDLLQVQASSTLVDLERAITGDLGRYGRDALTLTLLAGLGLVAVAIFGHVTTRRSEFGRRRALGASRPALVGLVVGHALLAAVPGVLLGSAAGLTLTHRSIGSLPGWPFTLGVAVLATLTAVLAALPPAVIAAWRDPVTVLRRA